MGAAAVQGSRTQPLPHLQTCLQTGRACHRARTPQRSASCACACGNACVMHVCCVLCDTCTVTQITSLLTAHTHAHAHSHHRAEYATQRPTMQMPTFRWRICTTMHADTWEGVQGMPVRHGPVHLTHKLRIKSFYK
eukprot:scaffold304059_cov21-Tisochrysis_lutea.AAC.1